MSVHVQVSMILFYLLSFTYLSVVSRSENDALNKLEYFVPRKNVWPTYDEE